MVDYLCRPRGGDLVAGSDVSKVVLADIDDLSRYDLTPKTLEVIARALSFTTGEQR